MIKNNKYKILTPSGFKNFDSIKKITKSKYLKITLSNGREIACSYDHKFILDGIEIPAYELYNGCAIDSVGDTDIYVIANELVQSDIELYDIVEVEDGNIFIVDNLVSHNCNFETSGHTVIEADIIRYYEGLIKEPLERRGFDGNLHIYQYPNYNKSYIVTADVARGDGEDYSAFHVLDAQNVEQVAEYKGKIDPASFANMLIAIGTEYNNALIVVDNRNIGYATLQVIVDNGYRNLYYTYKNDPFLDKNIHLRKGYDLKDKKDMVPGYSIDVKTRPVIIDKFRQYFEEKAIKVHSQRLINELNAFVWIDGKAQAQKNYNDDLIMALAIGFMVRDTSLKLLSIGVDLTKNALQRTHKAVYKTGQISNPYWEYQIGQNKESLKWLL